jgi:hypothetical protein
MQTCKKNAAEKEKVYLIEKVTTQTSDGGGSSLAVDEFAYDDKNRMISSRIHSDNYILKYSYNDDDRLKLAELYEHDGTTIHDRFTYEYAADTANIVRYESTGLAAEKFKMAITGNKVTQLKYYFYRIDYLYDARGNVTKPNRSQGESIPPYGTRIFDDQKSPFSMVVGFNPHFTFLIDSEIRGKVNNVIGIVNDDPATVTYTFNANGFPVSAKRVYKHGRIDTIGYEYLIR